MATKAIELKPKGNRNNKLSQRNQRPEDKSYDTIHISVPIKQPIRSEVLFQCYSDRRLLRLMIRQEVLLGYLYKLALLH